MLALQDRLLAEFGGLGGLRDGGLLDSALAGPPKLFAYDRASLFDLAAAYAFGLARNDPLPDGNKRMRFPVAAAFLELNGRRFTAPEAEPTLEVQTQHPNLEISSWKPTTVR